MAKLPQQLTDAYNVIVKCGASTAIVRLTDKKEGKCVAIFYGPDRKDALKLASTFVANAALRAALRESVVEIQRFKDKYEGNDVTPPMALDEEENNLVQPPTPKAVYSLTMQALKIVTSKGIGVADIGAKLKLKSGTKIGVIDVTKYLKMLKPKEPKQADEGNAPA